MYSNIIFSTYFDVFDGFIDVFDDNYITCGNYYYLLPVHISNDIRLGVIHYWLKGNSRDDIATKFNISSGGVTNIISEWRNNLGSFIVDDLRQLSLSLKKGGITPIECAIGFRIAKMMQRFGINEEQFEYFMAEIYNKCQILEFSPNQIGEYLKETVNLSNTVFPSQIPNYINTKKREIENLKEQTENMQKTISELNNKKLTVEKEIKSLIESNNTIREAIKWYDDVIKELKNNGIPIDNTAFFIQCLKSIKNEGYDVNKVIIKYSESIYLNESIEIQKATKQSVLQEIDDLENHKKFLDGQINQYLLKISKINELENIGFGLKELKTIYNTVIEIAKGNDIDSREAIEKFFKDLNEYDDIVDFKKKIEDLRKEASNLSIQISNNRLTLFSQQRIGLILQELLKIGISEKDISDINAILMLGNFDYYDNDSSNNIINKQALISELTKYRNIKLVINSLEHKQIQLKNNMTELENQIMILEGYMYILSIIIFNLNEFQLLLKKSDITQNLKTVFILLSINSNNKNNNEDFRQGNNTDKRTKRKNTDKQNREKYSNKQ
jgi:hypothetical protein